MSKLVAARLKDLAFVSALFDAGLLDRATLAERARQVSRVPTPVAERTIALAEGPGQPKQA